MKGKGTTTAVVTQMRAILPLVPWLQLIDCLLSIRSSAWIDGVIEQPREVFVGGRPRTQCMDIAHAFAIGFERSQDGAGPFCVAQGDIE